MHNSTSKTEADTLAFLVRWAESQPLVRAMLLTSTRAIPGGVSDIFSDYDVVLALSDVRPYAQSRLWLEAFGKVLVMYQDPLESDHSLLNSGNVVQFESGLKIDFTLVETQYIASLVSASPLPAEYDAGYRILLDKDGLTAAMQPATYRAYIPSPPSEDSHLEKIEGGLLDATYVAKYLRRGDRMAAEFILTNFLKDEHLRPLLEWHYELEHGWAVKAGLHGRRIERHLRPDLLADLDSTYAGPGLEQGWQALFRTLDLLCKAGIEVGQRLGYTYPEGMVRRALAYLHEIKDMQV